MKKICKISGEEFEINQKDLDFYNKIGVPEPSLCPDERQRRRMTWRNDRVFYKRVCDLTGKKIISMYDQDTVFPVYHQDEWWSDKWNALDYGRDFDFSRGFFEQFGELLSEVPRIGMDLVNCENSDYCNYCGDNKNCYIDIAGEGNEKCYFDLFTKYSKYVVDSTFAYNSEYLYECISCYKSYRCLFSIFLENCRDCFFSYDLKGCTDCFQCSNLRNKKYCIANKQYSKEDYFKKIESLNLSSYSFLEKLKASWLEVIEKSIHRSNQMQDCLDSTGDNLSNCKNVLNGFNVSKSEDSAFLYDVLDAKNCRDLNYSLYEPENSLEMISTLAMKSSGFCMASHYCRDTWYSDQCNNSSSLFGCIGLKNKEYCILNIQYTKEQYEKLVPKIIEHMKQYSEWGEFFPSSMSPFGYNETVANEYFPLSHKSSKNYRWKSEQKKAKYIGVYVDINDDIKDIDDDIIDKILECKSCDKNYKIIGPELQFYRKLSLPIPRECPSCRHLNRIKLRNPRELFDRNCDKCNKEIKSTYSQDRKEIVYCTECYHEEIY